MNTSGAAPFSVWMLSFRYFVHLLPVPIRFASFAVTFAGNMLASITKSTAGDDRRRPFRLTERGRESLAGRVASLELLARVGRERLVKS